MNEHPRYSGLLERAEREEWGLARAEARYRWALDPIDGTKAFVSNCFIFGTLIALLRDGRPILGGGPTLLGKRVVRTRPCARIADATVLATGGALHDEVLALLAS